MKDMPSESDYRAESDAHSLMRAVEVQGDKKRLAAAKKALRKTEDEARKSLLHAKVVKGLKKAFGD